jgi:hypothetical protein
MTTSFPWVGAVACSPPQGHPGNVVARMVIDGDRAYLLHESGAVISLR